MPQSTRQLLSRCLLAALALASPLLARGGEGKLAPVIDYNNRHDEAATRSLEEPNALLIAAEVMPFPADTNPPAGTRTKPQRDSSAGNKQSRPAVRFAAPFDPTREVQPQQQSAPLHAPHNVRFAPIVAARDTSPRTNALAPTGDRDTPQSSAAVQPPAVSPPQRFGVIQIAAEDSSSANRALQKPRQSAPQRPVSELPRKSAPPIIVEATRTPIEARRTEVVIASNPGTERVRAAKAASPNKSPIFQEHALEVAAASTRRSSPIIDLPADPIIRQSSTVALPPQPALASRPEPVLKLVEQTLPKRPAPMEPVVQLPLLPPTAQPVIQLADPEPLLAALQPSPAASDLPVPMDEPPLTEERMGELEELEAFELDFKPIHELSTRIRPEAGELPTNYAAARFVREGETAHRMGFSRSKAETSMTWEAPALCYRPLYFEDINLERHGFKIPLIQPALSAAHFFGRVPLMPYMMVNEGHFNCRYTLGHYRPGDYAPYSLYIPRLRLDASAAELAVAAGVIFAFP